MFIAGYFKQNVPISFTRSSKFNGAFHLVINMHQKSWKRKTFYFITHVIIFCTFCFCLWRYFISCHHWCNLLKQNLFLIMSTPSPLSSNPSRLFMVKSCLYIFNLVYISTYLYKVWPFHMSFQGQIQPGHPLLSLVHMFYTEKKRV